jgi:hypothetical protein
LSSDEVAPPPPEQARWPIGSRLLQLRPNAKRPYGGAHGNAHLGAVLDKDFVPTGDNVGIVLDGMWMLVDIDKPADANAQRWIAELERMGTWSQATPRQHASAEDRAQNPVGRHWLLEAPPGLLATGAKNVKIKGADGVTNVGDVKVRGYLVAPGSSITCDDGIVRSYQALSTVHPKPAPQWLVDFTKAVPAPLTGGGINAIPTGQHDAFLLSLGAFLHTRWGLAGEGLKKAIAQGIPLLDAVDPARPWTQADMERLARSATKLEAKPVADAGAMLPENIVRACDLNLIKPPVDWWIRHFVPKGELVMLYGPGGIGKSSWASWLAAQVTKAGGSFMFLGVEESFDRFSLRSLLCGADPESLLSREDTGRIKLPQNIQILREIIDITKVDVIYFDSVVSHFSHMQGLNTAERARLCLGPLAELAQATGTTIVCVFHENKSGVYMGSTEMINVARYVLRATRTKTGPLRIAVDKTNFTMPDYSLEYTATLTDATHPLTGHTQMEVIDDEGTLAAYKIMVPQAPVRAPVDDEEPEFVETDSQKPTPEPKKKRSQKKYE